MERKKNILLTIRQGKIGGGETHILQIAEHHNRSKYTISVLSFTEGEMVDRLKQIGIPCYVIKTTRPFDFRIWKQVQKLMKELKIDIIHAHGTRAMTNSFWAAKSLAKPVIYTVHGWSFHKTDTPFIYRLKIKIESYLTKCSNTTICVSKSNQLQAEKEFFLKNVIVIQNGIDIEKYTPYVPHKNLRKALGISKNKTIVIYVSRLTKQKDPLNMIQSMKYVLNTTKKIMLLIVGDGELRDACEQLVDKLNINDQVQFLGFRNDISALLNTSDIYCLPSLWEGLPIGLLEAMSMKKPCITTAVDGTKEIIKHNYNGLTVMSGNPKQLSEQILFLHKNVSFRNQLAENARETIEKQYSIETMIEKLDQVYAKLASQN